MERGRAAALDGAIDDPRGVIVGGGSEGWESGGFGSRRGAPVGRVCAFGKCGERRASLDNARGWFLGISEQGNYHRYVCSFSIKSSSSVIVFIYYMCGHQRANS